MTARATGRRRGRAEGDSRNQREEEQKQQEQEHIVDATFAGHNDELGRTIFSLSRLLSVAFATERSNLTGLSVAFATERSI